MSKTSTAASVSQTACHNVYDTPNQDSVCSMFRKDNHTDIMRACCGDAQIISYSGDCAMYCVALDQTVGELAKCLYSKGAPDKDGVWCSGNSKTIKTKDGKIPATAQASAISDDDDDDDKNKDDKKSTSSGTASSSKASETGNAAAGTSPQSGISTLGLAIGALLFSSMAIGAFEL
ncbi:hypothetical protein FAVG1_08411 [Fusarium avenaceum]|nr:hypothetical protein FAVG1_08411 [Fusarium avenaceum]